MSFAVTAKLSLPYAPSPDVGDGASGSPTPIPWLAFISAAFSFAVVMSCCEMRGRSFRSSGAHVRAVLVEEPLGQPAVLGEGHVSEPVHRAPAVQGVVVVVGRMRVALDGLARSGVLREDIGRGEGECPSAGAERELNALSIDQNGRPVMADSNRQIMER